MAEYIEREALMRRIKEIYCAECDSCPGGACLVDDTLDYIDSEPAADVAPVRHGRWIYNGVPKSVLSKCSECGIVYGSSSFAYCPNCGCKMDLEG